MATTGYEYDANGNQLRLVEPQGITAFTYDEENRLIGMGLPTGETVEYQYDGQGQRVRMKDPNVEVHYQYSGGQVISERDGAGAVIAYYVRGLGGRLISNVQTAGARYYHFDGLGSVVALTDSAGAKLVAYTYDEFGVLKQSTGQSWNSFGYTSSIYDATPNLYLMGARYYDPNLGRFITQDTWEGNAWDPWTKNLYAYGRGNPVTFIDPTGHASILPGDPPAGYDPSIDLELIEYKRQWQDAYNQQDQELMDLIAAQAAKLRSDNPGKWTVGADMSLADCAGFEGVLRSLVSTPLLASSYSYPTSSVLLSPAQVVATVVVLVAATLLANPETLPPHAPEYPGDDPTVAPGPGWTWQGRDNPGGRRGNWHHPEQGSLHPDVNHEPGIPPHWDWKDPKTGRWWRIFPDGTGVPRR